MIDVEIIFAGPLTHDRLALSLPAGSSVADALSAAADHFNDLDVMASPVGVFGELCEHHRLLQAGDRVELYRPLERDPKRARRERAARQAAGGSTGEASANRKKEGKRS